MQGECKVNSFRAIRESNFFRSHFFNDDLKSKIALRKSDIPDCIQILVTNKICLTLKTQVVNLDLQNYQGINLNLFNCD
jgi:hypothetical protein